MQLTAGDCFLLPRGWPFRLATDLALTPVDALTLLANARRNGGIACFNGGGDCFTVGGHFAPTGSHASMLLSVLPPIVHIRKESDKAALRWSLERMRQELLEPQPGGFRIAQRLAHMMLVQALRLPLAEGLKGGVGWLFALADKQMSVAINSVHADPAPLQYLTRWRMLLAGDKLANSSDPVSSIALSLGYESESAFSKAFKRDMGCSPRQFSRRRKLEPIAG